jgi:hypothetical protein
VLEKIKNRGFGGTTSFEFIQGATGSSSGQFLFLSDGPMVAIIMQYGDIEYPGEYLAFDGEEVSVRHIKPGQKSPLADFIFRYDRVMKEGFLGGALSSAWPLLDIEERSARLKCGQKEIEGRGLYELEYLAEKGMGDLSVKLYFDMETYRHVRTDYRVRIHGDMSVVREDPSIFDILPDSIYLLVERFDDFKEADGLMLPHSYRMDYSLEGQGVSFIGRWTLDINQHSYNGKIHPHSFNAQR